MDYLRLTPENLEEEHICCAISNNKDPQVRAKKDWLRARFDDGLVFLRAEARGKCFIEYIPGEKAWLPINADNYMHINCLWVSGSLKGHGYADELLEACIRDAKAKGKLGLTVVSSPKKQGFLSDPKYLAYKGFRPADRAEPYFELWYLPFTENAEKPGWKEHVKTPRVEGTGFTLYYSFGCPFTAKYVPLLEAKARELGFPFESIFLDSVEAARNAPTPWTNFTLFYNGAFVTHEILSEKKFTALAETLRGDQ